jgi:hypothetical protein
MAKPKVQSFAAFNRCCIKLGMEFARVDVAFQEIAAWLDEQEAAKS